MEEKLVRVELRLRESEMNFLRNYASKLLSNKWITREDEQYVKNLYLDVNVVNNQRIIFDLLQVYTSYPRMEHEKAGRGQGRPKGAKNKP